MLASRPRGLAGIEKWKILKHIREAAEPEETTTVDVDPW